jgi:hypothetical protein
MIVTSTLELVDLGVIDAVSCDISTPEPELEDVYVVMSVNGV